MKRILTFTLAMALCTPVLASEGAKKEHGKSEGASNRIKANWRVNNSDVIPLPPAPEEGNSSHSAMIPTLVVPITRDGHLVNYVFLSIRLVLANNVDAWKVRAKTHFMRDALVKQAHQHPFHFSEGTQDVDMSASEDFVRQAIAPWVPKDDIEKINFLSVDVLHG